MEQKESKDYIERDAALKAMDNLLHHHFLVVPYSATQAAATAGYKDGVKDADIRLRSIPAADVRPVVLGRWIHTTQPMGWRDEECAECSACGEDFVLDEWAMDDFTNIMHFCPNCGADMREDVKE